MLVNQEINDVKPYGKEIAPGIWSGINCDINLDEVEVTAPVYFGSSVRMEKGAKIIGPAMIGSGSIIKKNATIEESVVLGYTKVSPHAHIEKKIIAGKYIINPFGTSVDIEESDMTFLVDDARKEEGAISEEQKEIMEMIQNISELETSR